MNGVQRDVLTPLPPNRIRSRIHRTQLLLFGILSISTLLALVFVPIPGWAATTNLEALLAHGHIEKKEIHNIEVIDKTGAICDSTGGSPIGTFTLSSKECLQSGSIQSDSGTGTFTGEALAKTTNGVSTPSKLVLAVLAEAEGNVTADFDGFYFYKSYASDTFLDQITITGGSSGQEGILEVKLNVIGDLAVTGDADSGSAILKITVFSPLGLDTIKFSDPSHIDAMLTFEVPFNFGISGEFKIFVQALAGQNVNGPLAADFSATQTVNYVQPLPNKPLPLKVTLESVSVKYTPNGDVISDMGFEYPVAQGLSGSNPNTPPTAKIDKPSHGDSFNTTDTILLRGTGTDRQDGNLPETSLSWTSSLDGGLGSGTTLNASLSEGNHIITLTATDAQGATHTDTISVSVTLPGGGSSPGTLFSDSFEIAEWNGLWAEDSQNDWFRSTQRSTDGTYSAEVDGRATNATLTSRPIDLQGKTNATVTFDWFIEKGFDSGEFLAFSVSTDGGATWIEKARLRGNIDLENIWHHETFQLSGINSLRLRFRGNMSIRSEDANVDAVLVTAQ